MALAAEYGFYYRYPDEEEWQTMVPEIDTTWRDIVRPILEVRRTRVFVGEGDEGNFINDLLSDYVFAAMLP